MNHFEPPRRRDAVKVQRRFVAAVVVLAAIMVAVPLAGAGH